MRQLELSEGIRRGDLRGTVLKDLTVDRYKPKTGEPEDAIVVSFATIDDRSAKDLYSFLNGTFVEFRDIEVSAAPTLDNHYLVFVELTRTPDFFDNFDLTIKEVSRVAGNQRWRVRVLGDDGEYRLQDEEWKSHVATTPSEYQRVRGDLHAEQPEKPSQATADQPSAEVVYEFFRDSDLSSCVLEGNMLTLGGRSGRVKLKVLGFGKPASILESAGIRSAALDQEYDYHLNDKLNSMLGEMRAQWVGGKIVIYNPSSQSRVMVAAAV
jgi:hypothetical protein